MSRLIAVGDIHGQFDKLVDLMSSVSPCADDQVVFLGDYIDRGTQSAAVIDWLIDFQSRYAQTIFLRGNHEQMLLDAIGAVARRGLSRHHFIDRRESDLPDAVYYFVACGGRETLAAYAEAGKSDDYCETLLSIPCRHREFIEETSFFYESSGYFFVHAGVDPQDPTGMLRGSQCFLWERTPLWKSTAGWDKVVVHGHTPVAVPYFDDLEINLDTGAGYGSELTACDVLTGAVWQSSL